MVRPILEREPELAELGLAAREAKAGDGSVVLIEGEAGIGKSSLVDAIRSVLPADGRLLLGYCDDLATPRVLGPLRDLRDSLGTALTQALESGDRTQVFEGLRKELDWPHHPTVLVVEDVHWADEATLDVLRFLVRRIASLPAVLVLTYRDDELTPEHPLRQLLGLAVRVPRMRRLRLARLSIDAVRRLGSGTALDPERVYAVTSGNPFLVAEVLAFGDAAGVPPSIAEAVTARLGDLDQHSRHAIERLAVIPSTVERWLVEAVVTGGLAALGTAEQHGVLSIAPTRVAFRHELTRRAVADSLPTVRRVACNQAVLAALLARHHERAGGVDLSRILHHAAEVGDDDVLIQFGPLAAAEAVSAGSHREAVAHYRLVLDRRAAFAPAQLVELLEHYAVECYTIGLADLAVAAQEDAVRLRRGLGDLGPLGVGLRWLSRMYWWAGGRGRAEAAGAEAIEILTQAGDEHGLAIALSNQAQLFALAGRREEAIAVGERAVEMARGLVAGGDGDEGLLSHALNNVGMASWDIGLPAARSLLDESLQIALAAGEVEHACRAYVSITWHLTDDLRLDEADQLLDQAIELAEESEFLGFLRYLHVTRGKINLARGAWDEAEREGEWAHDGGPTLRCPALAVTGRVRVRRGDSTGDDMLAQAWQLAVQLGEAQRVGPAAAALIEAAWLAGDASDAAALVEPWYAEVLTYGYRPVAAEVGYWLRLAGIAVPMVESDHPYALLAAGRWREAAQAWQRAGCPYEHALALTESTDPADLLEALATLDELGAEPLARRIRVRLRDLGVSRIPRGPTPSTRDNPAGLTDRQVEVVRLLADGLTNSEIAARLVLSVRTVDTHVAAVLDKLDARTRRDAAARAKALGLVSR